MASRVCCFGILHFCTGLWAFGRDSKALADKVVSPLAALCEDMEQVSNMNLAVSNDTHKASNVYEIRRIQIAFLKMKCGLGSFSKYVPFEVVRCLMVDGKEARLEVTPREVTIFFSDIASFTTICEAMDPHQLLVLLSEYFSAMSRLILGSNGTLLEFIGDAILAVWNAPMLVEDHAFQAVEASVRMHEELERLRASWAARGFPEARSQTDRSMDRPPKRRHHPGASIGKRLSAQRVTKS